MTAFYRLGRLRQGTSKCTHYNSQFRMLAAAMGPEWRETALYLHLMYQTGLNKDLERALCLMRCKNGAL